MSKVFDTQRISQSAYKLYQNKAAFSGLVIILIITLIAIFAPWIAPHHYAEVNLNRRLEPPSLEYPFGTDFLGRCIFSRVIYGAQIALSVGVLVVVIEAGIGVTLGLLAGYYGGIVDRLITTLTDTIWALPPLVLALGVVTILGPGLINVVVAVAIVSWAPFTRITRAKVQSLRSREFIEAAVAIGESDFSIILRYIIPNIVPSIIVLATLTLPSAILSTTALSFLGLGAQPPTPDWGAILSEGRDYLRIAPWISTFPGLAIMITVLGFNLLGDGLRDILDPRLKI